MSTTTRKDSDQMFSWGDLQGMSETQAEAHMLGRWGCIPDSWNDPLFRDRVTGTPGQAELDAHMASGEQAYADSLGTRARVVWYERNIAGQGHPAKPHWLERNRG